MTNVACATCKEREAQGLPAHTYKEKQAACQVCEEKVERVLDLHHTNADLCSPECEKMYWLQIALD
jgi:hypothetical protein